MGGSPNTRRHSRNRLSRSARTWRSASLLVAPPLLFAAPAFADPPLPSIPNTVFNVTTFGAVGDGTTDNTTAIQNAINAAAVHGGIVEIPNSGTGVFESGVLNMASNVDLQIDSSAELQAKSGLSGSNSTFIAASGISNFEITGSGSGATEGRLDGHVVETTGTLNMITLSGAQTALIQGVQITNSPHEHINTGSSINNDITVNNVTINTPSDTANTDGIDPAGTNWLIENCNISDGDDDIAVKPLNQFCNNITVTNCTIGYGHGISIGGQTNATFNNFTVSNVTFTNTTNGFRLKAGRINGGLVQNLVYNNVTMTNVANPIFISSWYTNGGDHYPGGSATNSPTVATNNAITTLTPFWHNITFSNITSTDTVDSNSTPALIYGLPEAPIQGLTFNHVSLTANKPITLDFAGYNGAFNPTPNPAYEVLFQNSTIDGLPVNVSSATQFYQNGPVPTGLFDTVVVVAVPEPASIGLMAVVPILLTRRRRFKTG